MVSIYSHGPRSSIYNNIGGDVILISSLFLSLLLSLFSRVGFWIIVVHMPYKMVNGYVLALIE